MDSLLGRCKQVVSTLHFKGHLIEAVIKTAENCELFTKIEHLQEIMLADEDNPVWDSEELNSDNMIAKTENDYDTETSQSCSKEEVPFSESDQTRKTKRREHSRLKNSVPTRWNSVLTMVESILDLREAVTEVLKKLGKTEMCLDEEDFYILEQVRKFLKPFNDLTLLISAACPNLSLVPLMRTKIRKVCTIAPSDAPVIVKVKKRIVANIDKRIP